MKQGWRRTYDRACHILQALGLLGFCVVWVGCGSAAQQGGASAAASRYVLTTPLEALSQCREDAPRKQWAVVIGVNDYQDEGIPDLDGAVNDAWSFYHFLASPAGGAVPRVRMRLLLNKEATREAVVGALGKFLANACPQDQVIIYFAGHGLPEPERPEEAFLLVHDTKLTNLVGSGISMNQLPQFLKWRANKAGSLVMFVDACHSGTIKFPGKKVRGADAKERIELVAKGLEKAIEQHGESRKENWGAISAAASDQFAQELKEGCIIGGVPYQGGLFTCHLLKGFSGKADANNDYNITLDELFSYLQVSVPRDSRGQQRPQRSGSLDPNMVLAQTTTNLVSVPTVPEVYTGAQTHPLRPWIYVGSGLTLLTGGTGIVFGLLSQDSSAQADETFGTERTNLLDQADSQGQIATLSYGLAATFGTLTLGALLYDLFNPPEGIEDVYENPPWFELKLAPTQGGSMGWAQWNW